VCVILWRICNRAIFIRPCILARSNSQDPRSVSRNLQGARCPANSRARTPVRMLAFELRDPVGRRLVRGVRRAGRDATYRKNGRSGETLFTWRIGILIGSADIAGKMEVRSGKHTGCWSKEPLRRFGLHWWIAPKTLVPRMPPAKSSPRVL